MTEKGLVFAPPSGEHWLWVDLLRPLTSPAKQHFLSRVVGVMTIAPFAHLTFFEFQYQAYLFLIFHQTLVSRLAHGICIPLNVVCLLAALSQRTVFGFQLSLVAALLLWSWYTLVALRAGLWLLAGALLPTMLALWWPTDQLAHSIGPATSALACLGFAFVQACSHIPEPRLPPRGSFTQEWKTLEDRRLSVAWWKHWPALPLQAVFGTLNEAWAAPRLLPYVILMWLWRLGYQFVGREELQSYVQRALASGQPAIDFIGTGGGSFLRAAPRGLLLRCEGIHLLARGLFSALSLDPTVSLLYALAGALVLWAAASYRSQLHLLLPLAYLAAAIFNPSLPALAGLAVAALHLGHWLDL